MYSKLILMGFSICRLYLIRYNVEMIDNAYKYSLLAVKQSFTIIPLAKATFLTRYGSIIESRNDDR